VVIEQLNVRIKRRAIATTGASRVSLAGHVSTVARRYRSEQSERERAAGGAVTAGQRRGGRLIAASDGGNESRRGRRARSRLLLRLMRRRWPTDVRLSECPVVRHLTGDMLPAGPRRCRLLLYGAVGRFRLGRAGLKFTPDRTDWLTLTAEMEIEFTPAHQRHSEYQTK